MGINPFGIVQVGCGLPALGFPSQAGKTGGLSPRAKCSAPGQLSQDLEKRLVGLVQALGCGQCELVMALSGRAEFVGSTFRFHCTFIRIPPFSSAT